MSISEQAPETGIAIRPEGELQVAPQAAGAMQEIQAAMFLAKRFPRDEEAGKQRLLKACQRKTLAQAAEYSFPRGGSQVKGPSVNLARVAGAAYGNVRYGLTILRDDDDSMLVQGWAWDIENNVKVTADDSFKKLIYRKKGGWIKPDERDLRELVNRRGAILIRNCLLQIVPRDFVDDGIRQCRETLTSSIKNLDESRENLVGMFDKIGVTLEMLREYVGHSAWSKEDLLDLHAVYTSIKDGNSKREDYFTLPKAKDQEMPPANGQLDPEQMTAGDPADHQAHEPDKPQQNYSLLDQVVTLKTELKVSASKFAAYIKEQFDADKIGYLKDEQLKQTLQWLESQQ